MMRRRAGLTMGWIATMMVGLLLTAGALAAPAVAASGSIVTWWQPTGGGSPFEQTYPCTTRPAHVTKANPLEVYNTCDGRVWLHYYDDGAGNTDQFCVNPGGFLAYGFNDSGGFLYGLGKPATDFQVTTNASPCDSGQNLHVTWLDVNGTSALDKYDCEKKETVSLASHAVYVATNDCVVRVWLHGRDSNAACIDPGGSSGVLPPSEYSEVQETPIQAQCSAGSPPYSY
jgi:hypothetical protein